MISYPEMRRGIFLERRNRFLARVLLEGQETSCHVKNTGRCRELLQPGVNVWCQHHTNQGRKTEWSLITVEKAGRLFNLDSLVPNRLAGQWLQEGGLGTGLEELRAEQFYKDSRFDWRFMMDEKPCFLEVKGVTLEENGIARFPDAPTERGRKHLHCLEQAVGDGYGAFVLFVCQMDGILAVEPNWRQDPAFAEALCRAADAGVQIQAVQCAVTPDTIAVSSTVPVQLR